MWTCYHKLTVNLGPLRCKSLLLLIKLEVINGLNNILKAACLIITVLPLFSIIPGETLNDVRN